MGTQTNGKETKEHTGNIKQETAMIIFAAHTTRTSHTRTEESLSIEAETCELIIFDLVVCQFLPIRFIGRQQSYPCQRIRLWSNDKPYETLNPR